MRLVSTASSSNLTSARALDKARFDLEGAFSAAERNGFLHSMIPRILDTLGELEIACKKPWRAREWLVRELEFRHDSGERYAARQTFDWLAGLAALCSDH